MEVKRKDGGRRKESRTWREKERWSKIMKEKHGGEEKTERMK